jgi:general secretion pathway protein A
MFENYYGFNGNPFQLNPDPSFYFESKGHGSAYAYLKYGVFQSEGFLVVTGEIGAGKTTLVRALLEELDPRKVVAVQLVSTQLEADDLLRAVAVAFGLSVKDSDKARLLATLEAFLTQLVMENRRALLIVDEAQNLSPRAVEELRMLSNFQLKDRALLQSFLVGQPELRPLLRSPSMEQLRQRVIASCHLGPLQAPETRGYVEHRLRRVGWDGANPAFDDGAFATIHEASGGIPRRINGLCGRLLLSGYLSERRSFTAEDVKAVADEIAGELGGSEEALADASLGAQELAAREGGARGDTVVRPFALPAISARLDRIERALRDVLELLRGAPVADRRPRGSRSKGS